MLVQAKKHIWADMPKIGRNFCGGLETLRGFNVIRVDL